MSIEPGTRLGPYEITALLGRGGMGEVFRATDTRLHGVSFFVGRSDYAPSRDGQRFLVNVNLSEPAASKVTVIQGWHEGP